MAELRQAKDDAIRRLESLKIENKKLLDSYDVLKEHEVNIIKDVQERKVRDRQSDVDAID